MQTGCSERYRPWKTFGKHVRSFIRSFVRTREEPKDPANMTDHPIQLSSTKRSMEAESAWALCNHRKRCNARASKRERKDDMVIKGQVSSGDLKGTGGTKEQQDGLPGHRARRTGRGEFLLPMYHGSCPLSGDASLRTMVADGRSGSGASLPM